MPTDSLLSDEEVKHAVRRATIEVFAVKEAKLPLTTVCQIPVNSDLDISDIKFTRSKGKTSIGFGHGITQKDIIDLINTDETNKTTAMPSLTAQEDDESTIEISNSDVKFEQSTVSNEVIHSELSVAQSDIPTVASLQITSEVVPVHDDTWLAVPLGNSTIKFAVCGIAIYVQTQADQFPGVEACDAVDGQADIRSCNIQDNCCSSACGRFDGKA